MNTLTTTTSNSQKWNQARVDYKLLEVVGTGAFGTVCKALHRKSRKPVAIKLIEGVNMSTYTTRKVLREVQIMASVSQMSSNIFTSKLIDLILPEGELTHLFVVMSLGQRDVKSLVTTGGHALNESHIITIVYNLLCSLGYLHSLNIIHRDIKPANLLINDKCGITICDFGLARANPKMTKLDLGIEAYRKKNYQRLAESSVMER